MSKQIIKKNKSKKTHHSVSRAKMLKRKGIKKRISKNPLVETTWPRIKIHTKVGIIPKSFYEDNNYKKELHFDYLTPQELLNLAKKNKINIGIFRKFFVNFSIAPKSIFYKKLVKIPLTKVKEYSYAVERIHNIKGTKEYYKKHPNQEKEILKKMKKERQQILKTRVPIPSNLKYGQIKTILEEPNQNVGFKSRKLKNIKTGIEGLDALLGKGIVKGSRILLSGGAGSGKTLLGLDICYNAAKRGEKAIYISLEESPDRLVSYMEQFGWKPNPLLKSGKLIIQKLDPIVISSSVEELLAQASGELLIEADPMLLPKGFKPDWVVFDSIAALASTYVKEEESYRIYIEQLFKFLEKIGSTSFLISETEELPGKGFTKGKVEDFLADGIIILYHIRKGNFRQRAIEILKLRGVDHTEKVVSFDIIDKEGIKVYPEQEMFGDL